MREFGQEKLEQKEKEPKVSYHFLFGHHETAKDFEKLPEIFQKTDVYVPELCRRGPLDEFNFNALSKGKIIPKDMAMKFGAKRTDAQYQEFRVIYNSKKPILLCDVPIWDFRYGTKLGIVNHLYKRGMGLFKKGDFKKSLLKIRSGLEAEVKLESEREERIKKSLNNKIGKFLKKNPNYAQKENLKVLVNLGASHTKIYQNLAKKGKMPISREFNRIPFIYPVIGEAQRRILFGKELNDELIARLIIDEFIDPLLSKISLDSQKIDQVSRKILSQLTLGNMEKISRNFTHNNRDIAKALKDFKIEIPSSEKEMDKML